MCVTFIVCKLANGFFGVPHLFRGAHSVHSLLKMHPDMLSIFVDNLSTKDLSIYNKNVEDILLILYE